ncbi:hypothetical protein BN1723_008240, partial [Verticillium longisporum]
MTIKQSGDGSAAQSDTMLDRLRSVQAEHWRKLKYTDENDEAAWEVYNESLHLRDRGAKNGAAAAPGKDLDDDLDEDGGSEKGSRDKGKDKADPGEEDEGEGKEGDEKASKAVETLSIAENASKLGTDWNDEDLLEAVSGIVKPKPISKEEQKRAAEEAAAAQAAAEAAAKARPRARGGAVARGRGRGRGATTRGA